MHCTIVWIVNKWDVMITVRCLRLSWEIGLSTNEIAVHCTDQTQCNVNVVMMSILADSKKIKCHNIVPISVLAIKSQYTHSREIVFRAEKRNCHNIVDTDMLLTVFCHRNWSIFMTLSVLTCGSVLSKNIRYYSDIDIIRYCPDILFDPLAYLCA